MAMAIGTSGTLKIDRRPFDPATFIGREWTIWRGPADGNGLTGPEEQDERSLALTGVNLNEIKLVTMIKPDEPSITGEENLRRLRRANYTLPDAGILKALWEKKRRIPKQLAQQDIIVFFNGTVLCSPHGLRYVLCLYCRGGEWHLYFRWLGRPWYSDNPSAVLAAVAP